MGYISPMREIPSLIQGTPFADNEPQWFINLIPFATKLAKFTIKGKTEQEYILLSKRLIYDLMDHYSSIKEIKEQMELASIHYNKIK